MFFFSLEDVSDEPIYTYKNQNKKWFVRHSIKGGRCPTFIQFYKYKKADNIFEAISEDLNVKGNNFEVFEAYVKYASKKNRSKNNIILILMTFVKLLKKKEKVKYHITKLPLQLKLGEFNLTDVLTDIDATSSYPSAMWDDNQ